ncbi:hypothetical protein DXG01_006016 [Tephrocybe rancida]|nr:hypothetical protein DXG01_006016 [Tephrocybe rancida]
MDHAADNLQKAAQTIAAPLPLVSLQRGAQHHLQEFPNIMPLPKSSTSQSSLLAPPRAGPSSKPISKPASTAPVDIDPQSQVHADTLAKLGIKVRDFAYESKLPPVQPYRVRQIQPGPRPLKRNRRDGEENEDDVFQDNSRTGPSEGSSSKRSKLEREDTEPDITQQQSRPTRARGFMNLNEYEPQTPPWFQSQPPELSQPSGLSQPPQILLDSQDSEPYVVTPIVTPNGSLQWPDVGTTSDITASQLDTESQANDPILLTYSQLGMPEPDSQLEQPEPEFLDTTGTGLVGKLTPMSSLSSVGSDASAPEPRPFASRASNSASTSRDSPLSRSSTSSPPSQKPLTPPVPTSRYQLRRRPIPPSPQSPTKIPTHNRRKMYNAAHPLSRTVPYSMQSSHSKAKTSSTPHSRLVRSRGGPSNRDEAMVVR